MKKRMKTISALFVVSLVSYFLFTSFSFGQEMPKPGEVIDKSNYKKYAHLFPEEFLPFFENGYGIQKPISIKVSETRPDPIPKRMVTLSEKNRGKVTLDKNGIAVGYDFLGFPFPGATKEDKDFGAKLMWNFTYRYYADDIHEKGLLMELRKGERISTNLNDGYFLYFYNRLYLDPKPLIKTPNNLFKAMLLVYKEPPGTKDLMLLNVRHADIKTNDDGYLYLPTLRRVLRSDTGARSTPVQGSTNAPDDFNIFDGNPTDFTFEFVGEKKVLAVPDSKATKHEYWKSRAQKGEGLIEPDGWELKDVYVIDIKSKDPNYPQSKKRFYLDKENLTNPYYGVAWDRGNKIWKVWYMSFGRYPLPDGEHLGTAANLLCVDVQFGLINCAFFERKLNVGDLQYSDFMPSGLARRAR